MAGGNFVKVGGVTNGVYPLRHSSPAPRVALGKVPDGAKFPELSSAYTVHASPYCFWLLRQFAIYAFCFALAKAGNNIAAKMAMMAMTTNNSINVNAGSGCRLRFGLEIISCLLTKKFV